MNRKHIIRNLRAKGVEFDHNLSTKELNDLLNQAGVVNKVTRTTPFTNGAGKIQVTYNATQADGPVQVMVCEDIGKDPWTGEGFCLKDLQTALAGVDNQRDLDFQINSPGGYVSAGTAIRNWLSNWGGVINQTIIGVAASTASWCIPADKTRAFKNSQFFMHRAMAAPFGNRDDLLDAVSNLDKTDSQIAGMYAEQAASEPEEMLALMKGANGQGTLLTGQEALAAGLVDELIDGEATNQFTTEQLNAMRQKLAALNSLRAGAKGDNQNPSAPAENQKPTPIPAPENSDPAPTIGGRGAAANQNNNQNQTIMNKEKMIALLNKWGVTVPVNATDEQLLALVEAGPKTITNSAPSLSGEDKALLESLRHQVVENRRREIRTSLENLASVDGGQRIPVNEIENWEKQAIEAKDGPEGNPILNSLKKLPAQQPGIPALNDNSVIELTGDSFKDVQKFCIENGPGFRKQFLGNKAGNELDSRTLKDIGARALAVANCIAKNKKMLVEMFNANSIDADLQRQVIMQDMLEAYALNLLPLDAFSIKYESVPLQGTDSVVVPYFPLQATSSNSFVKGTGYTTKSDWLAQSRKVIIGGDGDAASNGANATAGTAKNRLFQAIDFSSYDMRRQPYLNVVKLAQQAANKLGVDIASEIYSRVLVVGNFGAAVKTVAAALFSPDDVADLSEYADTAEWPAIARSLVLTNAYKTPLLKDATFKSALAYGSTDPIRKAQIQEAYGFENMYFIPNLAAKLAANTAGFICHKSAVLVAFAPIMPTPEVRNLLTAYDVAVEPRSGAVLEYRKFGNATTDTTTEVIESSFGANKGVDGALKLVKSA